MLASMPRELRRVNRSIGSPEGRLPQGRLLISLIFTGHEVHDNCPPKECLWGMDRHGDFTQRFFTFHGGAAGGKTHFAVVRRLGRSVVHVPGVLSNCPSLWISLRALGHTVSDSARASGA